MGWCKGLPSGGSNVSGKIGGGEWKGATVRQQACIRWWCVSYTRSTVLNLNTLRHLLSHLLQ